MASKSNQKTSSRRPKLMRAAATCPQLATSNACRNDLATLQSYGATTILSRVAGYSNEQVLRMSPRSACSSPGQRSPESASERKEPFEVTIHQCEYQCRGDQREEKRKEADDG